MRWFPCLPFLCSKYSLVKECGCLSGHGCLSGPVYEQWLEGTDFPSVHQSTSCLVRGWSQFLDLDPQKQSDLLLFCVLIYYISTVKISKQINK